VSSEPNVGGVLRRLFFAIWPDEVSRDELARATREAVAASGGRSMAVENLHATLLFLGSVPESRVCELGAISVRVTEELRRGVGEMQQKARIVFDQIEFWKKARVVVASVSAPSGAGYLLASTLAALLQRETLRAGFTPDLKPFRPHVTVARKVSHYSLLQPMRAVSWSVAGFALVESLTGPEGSVYRVVEAYSL
jgi:RNA 2',3'-cyclic 3'-phosphodiesterase